MIIKAKKRHSYTMMSTESVQGKLSFSAIGLLLWCLGRPPKWHFSFAGTLAALKKEGKEIGESALRRIVNELQENGHIYIPPKTHRADGTWFSGDWEVYECPADNPHYTAANADKIDEQHDSDETEVETPVMDNPVVDNPVVDDPVVDDPGEYNNYQDINISTYYSIEEESNQSEDKDDDLTAVREEICIEIGYDQILSRRPRAKKLIDEMVDILAKVGCYMVDSMRINGEELNRNQISKRLSQIEAEHIIGIIDTVETNTRRPIRDMRAYLATALYNAVPDG